MDYAIVLAGGIGSRFWPLSRDTEPKQFLNLYSARPMIEETLKRARRIIPPQNTYIATNKLYLRRMKKCRRMGIPLENILFEPLAKNTLGPIGLLASRIYSQDQEAVIVVLPCDHLIKDTAVFLKSLKEAIGLCRKGWMVAFGIRPRMAETGYGYIKAGKRKKGSHFYLIDRFTEKPDYASARRFVKDKRYFWNSGIFVFKAGVILKEIKRFAPAAYGLIARMRNSRQVKELWPNLPSVSIDYGVMEKTRRQVLLPVDFGWSDLGSWQALEAVAKKDRDGNILKGNSLSLECKNIVVWAGKRLVATLGLRDAVIVDTPDTLLVCSKDMAQEVKRLVAILKRRAKKRQR